MQFAQIDCNTIIILTQCKRLYAAPLLLNFCARSFEHISEMLPMPVLYITSMLMEYQVTCAKASHDTGKRGINVARSI